MSFGKISKMIALILLLAATPSSCQRQESVHHQEPEQQAPNPDLESRATPRPIDSAKGKPALEHLEHQDQPDVDELSLVADSDGELNSKDTTDDCSDAGLEVRVEVGSTPGSPLTKPTKSLRQEVGQKRHELLNCARSYVDSVSATRRSNVKLRWGLVTDEAGKFGVHSLLRASESRNFANCLETVLNENFDSARFKCTGITERDPSIEPCPDHGKPAPCNNWFRDLGDPERSGPDLCWHQPRARVLLDISSTNCDIDHIKVKAN